MKTLFFFFGDRLKNFVKTFFFFLESTCACVLGPWPWPRAFLSLASRVSVLGKAVLGLGPEPCVLDSNSDTYSISYRACSFDPSLAFFLSCSSFAFSSIKLALITQQVLPVQAGLNRYNE